MAERIQDNLKHPVTPEGKAAILVDEGLGKAQAALDDDGAELKEIGAEIERIKASIAHIADSTSHYVKRRVAENSTDLISENPLRAALWAAFAGFLIGRLSR